MLEEIIIKKNSLGELYPKLVQEWNTSKNGNLTSFEVTPGSHKKVWWKCQYGHEWQAVVSSRARGNGCPYCSGREAGYGNSLGDKNPPFVNEWNQDKNGNLTPFAVKPSSNKKVWWKCQYGHEWQATIVNRNKGRSCPYCAGKKVGYGNSLSDKNPQLAKEWHPTKNGKLKPTDVLPATHKKVWWICSQSHEWQATIKDRNNGTNCPYCTNRKVGYGNSLADKYPRFTKEWHTTMNGKLKPTDVTSGSDKKVWWQCVYGHEWQAAISNRVNGRGCPICSNKISAPIKALSYCFKDIFSNIYLEYKIDNMYVDIYIKDINLVVEYDGPYYHTGKKNFERDVQKSKKIVGNDKKLLRIRPIDNNFPLCKITGTNIYSYIPEAHIYFDDFKKVNNFVNEILDYIYSIEKSYKINKLKLITFESNAQLYDILAKNLPLELSLAYKQPVIAKEWHLTKNGNLKALDVTIGSKKVWWQCKKGHEWQAAVTGRIKGNGCPYCSGRIAGYGNTLGDKNPELAKQWHPSKNDKLTPFNFTLYSHKKVWWQCKKGHEWQATIASRTNGSGCPYCANQKVGYGNSLADKNINIAKEWHPTKNENLKSSDVTPGSHKKVWWICDKGHEWQAIIKNRTNGTGCPYCSGRRKY